MTVLFAGLQAQLNQPVATPPSTEARLWQSNVEAQLAELQASLLALDDIKQTLQVAVEQNRLLKGDLDLQQQQLGKLVADLTQKAVADALAQSSADSENIGQVVGDRVCDSLREQLGTRFSSALAQQLTDSLNNDFAQPLSSQLLSQLRPVSESQGAGSESQGVSPVCSTLNSPTNWPTSSRINWRIRSVISSPLPLRPNRWVSAVMRLCKRYAVPSASYWHPWPARCSRVCSKPSNRRLINRYNSRCADHWSDDRSCHLCSNASCGCNCPRCNCPISTRAMPQQ